MKTKVALLLFTALGITYYWPQSENASEKILLQQVIRAVENHHLQPRPLNDDLSREMYQMYLSQLDPDKVFFTQRDIDQLSRFELLLDEELKNGTFEFYEKSQKILTQKMAKVATFYPAFLTEKPKLDQQQRWEGDSSKLEFATDESALQDRWEKRVRKQLLEELWSEEQRLPEEDTEAQYEAAIQRTYRYFEKWFERYQKVTDKERQGQYVNAFLKIHDVQTEYLSPVEKQQWDNDFTRSLVGIGGRLEMVNGYPQLKELVVGGPAWKTRVLEEGDIILKIGEVDQESVDVFGMDLPEVLQLLRGQEGSAVVLTVEKANAQIVEVKVIRDQVALDQSMAFLIHQDIGYIKLPRFYAGDHGCADDVLQQIKQLDEQGISGLIIDVRNNKGGSAREVIKMLGYFLEEGVVMQSSYRDGSQRQYRDEDTTVQYSGKLLVMVNTRSSSGSELFAGTLQDYQRALVVGSTATYGKGSIQRFFNLTPEKIENQEDLGNVKLTTGRFYTAAGRSPQYKGIIPDILLPAEDDWVPSGERVYHYALQGEDLPFHQVTQSVCQPPDGSQLRKKSIQRVQDNPRFQSMANYALQMKEKHENTELDLSFASFKLAKEQQLEQSAQYDSIFAPIPHFEVSVIPNPDPVQHHKTLQWRERIQGDPYVQECYLIMRNMVG